MTKVLSFVLVFFILLSCKSSSSREQPSLKVSSNVSENIYNLSNNPEINRLKTLKIELIDYKIIKKFNFNSNYRQNFLKIYFPFSFYVNNIYVRKGDDVKKGDKLFDVYSEELNTALNEYKKTADQSIASKLKNIGIPLNANIPITNVYITVPEDGTIISINVEKQNKYPPQELATIQLNTYAILEGAIPASSLTSETQFFVLSDSTELPVEAISQELIGNTAKVKFSIKTNLLEKNTDKVMVKAVSTINNVAILPKEAIMINADNTYIFVYKGDGIVEKRSVTGFVDGDNFIITDDIKENEIVFVEGVSQLSKLTN